jgi:hypothetical protein
MTGISQIYVNVRRSLKAELPDFFSRNIKIQKMLCIFGTTGLTVPADSEQPYERPERRGSRSGIGKPRRHGPTDHERLPQPEVEASQQT